MKGIISFGLMFIFLVSVASAANIHGTIYDMSLKKVENAIVEIDTTPNQRMVSVNSSYSLNVPKGDYTITASYNDGVTVQKTEEKISVIDEGNYVLDLFLFIDISEEEELFDETDIDISVPYKTNAWPYLLAGFVLLLILSAIYYFSRYRKKQIEKKISKIENRDLDKIILILKKHQGRATQKEIRKEIPLSEAKISLMISELESEGKIKRIKKGRGNIIILQ